MIMSKKERKVVVIGAGRVGTSYIYALMHTGLAAEIVLIDLDPRRVAGEIMDLSHGLPFVPPVNIRAGDYSDCSDAHLIVITAGAKQTPHQSRLDLVQNNAKIVKSICSSIKPGYTSAIIIMVTNPVDILTYVALKHLGCPPNRILGSGTVLDTARLKYILSLHCGLDTHNIHAYVLGEHGDSEVVAWSLAHIAGVPLTDYCALCRGCDSKEAHEDITQSVRDSAYHIVDYKGSTYYAIGLSLTRISAAILRDEHSVLTVSTLLQGQYHIEDICLSVPCVVGADGIERIITAPLSDCEQTALESSAGILKKTLSSISS